MSAGSGGRRKRGGHEEEEHVNHERWLVSYADMVTLLMCLFIVMFAISQVDKEKLISLQSGMPVSFGGSATATILDGASVHEAGGGAADPFGGAASPAPVTDEVRDRAEDLVAAQERAAAEQRLEAARAEVDHLAGVQADITAALAEQGLLDRVSFRVTADGLVVAVVADDVFFASASAQIRPEGLEVVHAVAPVLRALPNDVRVEGHANHLPLSTRAFPSNWELSAARAASVVRRLIDAEGIAAERLAALGYGSTRPLLPPSDPRALTTNRRVDVVVVSTQPADVRSLLPTAAAEKAAEATAPAADADHAPAAEAPETEHAAEPAKDAAASGGH
jgi:chemotaxis protein MotB